jgi:hypothetical protein
VRAPEDLEQAIKTGMMGMVHFRGPDDVEFNFAISVDLSVAAVLELAEVRRGNVHNLYCESVLGDNIRRLRAEETFVDVVPRRASVRISEQPLVFHFSYGGRSERTDRVKDTDRFRDIQPLARDLLGLHAYTVDRIEFTVDSRTISEEDEPSVSVVDYYKRSDDVEIRVTARGIRYEFVLPSGEVAVRRFQEDFTLRNAFDHWFEQSLPGVDPRTKNVRLKVGDRSLDPRDPSTPLHLAVAAAPRVDVPVGGRVSVTWEDFEYDLHFPGGSSVVQLPYSTTVAELKGQFGFQDPLEKELLFGPGAPRTSALDRLTVTNGERELEDTAVLGRDVAMLRRTEQPLDRAVLTIGVRDPTFVFTFGDRTLDLVFPTETAVLVAEREVSLQFEAPVRIDAVPRAALADRFPPSAGDGPAPQMHEVAVHRTAVRCVAADWVYDFLFGEQKLLFRISAQSSVSEACAIVANHLGVAARTISIAADPGAVMSEIDPRSTIRVENVSKESFRLRTNEGVRFEINLPPDADVSELNRRCRDLFEGRQFELFVGERLLEKLPRTDRATIEVRFEDIPLFFRDESKRTELLVPRTAPLAELRRQFLGRSPNLIAFLIDGDPLPLRKLAGSFAPYTEIFVEHLNSEAFKVEGETFPMYTTVGAVRERLRKRTPERRFLIGDQRGTLPNSALLVRSPTVEDIPPGNFPVLFSEDSDYIDPDPDRELDHGHTSDDLRIIIAQHEKVNPDRVQLFVGRFELLQDDFICESGGPIKAVFREPHTPPNAVTVRYANGAVVLKKDIFNPAKVHLRDLTVDAGATGTVTVDWGIFSPEKTLAEVGWKPSSIVFAAPPIDAAAFFATRASTSSQWIARNVERESDVVIVNGPTVAEAIDQITKTRKRGKKTIVLRAGRGAPPFTDPAQMLVPETELEFIDSSEAQELSLQDYDRIDVSIQEHLSRQDWLNRLEANHYDRIALRNEIEKTYPAPP